MAKGLSTEDVVASLRQKNAKLEAEVTRLRKHASKSPPEAGHGARRIGRLIRKPVVMLCVVGAVMLLTVGNTFFWAGNTLVKPDRFVATTAPIIRDPKVQQAMSLYTTNRVFDSFNVSQTIAQALPPRAAFLAPQFTSQLKAAVQITLHKALATPRLQNTWNRVVAKQHERLITFARTYHGDGTITLNDVFKQLTANLADTKLSFLTGKQLPASVGSITIVTVHWLPVLHAVVNNIDVWRTLSILGFVAFAVLAIGLSRNKRRTVYILSLLLVAGLAVSLVVLRVLRQRIIDKVDPQYGAGVARALQIVFHGLVVQTITTAAALLVLACVAWISGDSTSAQATKLRLKTFFTGKLHGAIFSNENRFTVWVGNNRRWLEWGVVAVSIILMLILRLTLKILGVCVVLSVLAVVAIEVVSAQAKRQTTQSHLSAKL